MQPVQTPYPTQAYVPPHPPAGSPPAETLTPGCGQGSIRTPGRKRRKKAGPNWQDRAIWFSLGAAIASTLTAATALVALRQLKKRDDFFIEPWPPSPLPPVDGGPVEILPFPKPIHAFEINGPRFADTRQLRLHNKGQLWNQNDLTIRGTIGSDIISVDQHWASEGGRKFFRREGGRLRILEGDPGEIAQGFKLDSVIENIGKDLWRQKKTGRVFKAALDKGPQSPIQQ